MTSLHVGDTRTVESVVDDAAIEKLKASVRGQVLRPVDPTYDDARKIWNGMIDRRPAVIVKCSGVADVIEAVNFARDQQLRLAVRGGSHSAAGHAMCDGGLVIDLCGLKAVRIDQRLRTAIAQGGLTWGEFDRETQALGLATTGGTVTNTGIGGLTLGGGLGWLMGKHAFACDNVLSADLVTADGKLITASADEHPDLLWALKGGGGNFGVVTAFEFQLHEVGPTVLGGMVLYPRAASKDVLRFYREYCSTLPDEAEAFAALLTSPDGDPLIAMLLGYTGDLAQGERVLAPARQFGSPIADLVSPMPYVQRQTLIDDLGVYGIRRYWKSGFMPELSDDALDLIIDRAASMTSPMSVVGLFYVHGAAARVDPTATAFGQRGAKWDFSIISQWTDSSLDDEQVRWTRSFWNDAEPYATGVYLNHIAADEPGRVHSAYGPNYDRLLAVKRQYDPANLFRLNHNIAP
ncbi:MAG: FAD-binding oxidoreductase [Chloroflexota bacterium]